MIAGTMLTTLPMAASLLQITVKLSLSLQTMKSAKRGMAICHYHRLLLEDEALCPSLLLLMV